MGLERTDRHDTWGTEKVNCVALRDSGGGGRGEVASWQLWLMNECEKMVVVIKQVRWSWWWWVRIESVVGQSRAQKK